MPLKNPEAEALFRLLQSDFASIKRMSPEAELEAKMFWGHPLRRAAYDMVRAFSFIPCSGGASDPKPGPMPTRVRALEDRIDCEMTFPRLLGYRYDITDEDLEYQFTEDSRLSLSTADIPTITENRPIVGQTSIHKLDDLKARREQEVAWSGPTGAVERQGRRHPPDPLGRKLSNLPGFSIISLYHRAAPITGRHENGRSAYAVVIVPIFAHSMSSIEPAHVAVDARGGDRGAVIYNAIPS